MDYILSPCSLVADGLVKVMMANSMQPVVLPSDATTLPGDADIRRIIVFLPETPARLLATLQQAAAFLEHSATPLPMLILPQPGQLAVAYAAASGHRSPFTF